MSNDPAAAATKSGRAVVPNSVRTKAAATSIEPSAPVNMPKNDAYNNVNSQLLSGMPPLSSRAMLIPTSSCGNTKPPL